jgi:hypothetical protein
MTASPDDKAYVELGTTFSRGAVGAPVTATQTEILRMLFTPDEAHCAAALDYTPEPEEIIAARAGVARTRRRPADAHGFSGLIRGVGPDGVRVFACRWFPACSRWSASPVAVGRRG